MLCKPKTGCFQPLLSVFKLYGLQFGHNDEARSSGLICIARFIMVYLTASGSAFIAYLLGYHLIYKMEDIHLLCLWASVQSMFITSLIFYLMALIRQNVLKDFFKDLAEALNTRPTTSSTGDPKATKDSKFIRRLCCGLVTFAYATELMGLLNAGLELVREHQDELVFKEIVYNIVGIHEDPHNLFFFYFITLLYQFLLNTFLHMYAALLPVISLTLSLCLKNLKEEKGTFKEYCSKHRRICHLVEHANALFSPFLFIVVIRDVIVIVLASRMFKSHYVIWHNLNIIWMLMQSMVSLCGQMFCASILNAKVSGIIEINILNTNVVSSRKSKNV